MPETHSTAAQPALSRDRLLAGVLIAMTALGITGCLIIAAPFLSAMTWAVAIAVVTHPAHAWIAQRIKRPGVAAAVAVAVIAVGLLAPSIFVLHRIIQDAGNAVTDVQKAVKSGEIKSRLEQNAKTAGITRWVLKNVDVERELRELSEFFQSRLGGWVRSTVWTVTQILITMFLLFYLFRDRQEALNTVCSLLPLSNREADELVERVRSMIHATIYGTGVVSAIQGALGGLMFWILGIPGALLWGVVMGLLAIIPVLGAFVVWLPVAIGLAAQGAWVKAVVLAVWGTVVVGMIDNLLYPMLVGKEVRIHTVPVFIAIVGGLFIFGASGLVLGPMVLVITLACIDVLRRRTAGNRSAQEPS